jgi:uncharacterized coiled-coil DUF342 family protein
MIGHSDTHLDEGSGDDSESRRANALVLERDAANTRAEELVTAANALVLERDAAETLANQEAARANALVLERDAANTRAEELVTAANALVLERDAANTRGEELVTAANALRSNATQPRPWPIKKQHVPTRWCSNATPQTPGPRS